VWLDGADANTVTLTGSTVTQWRDKSSNSYLGTSTTGRNFTYATSVRNGLNSVQTAIGQGMLVSNVALGPALSAFVVYMPINQADGSPFIEHGPDTNSGRGFFIQANTAGQLGISNLSGYMFNNVPTTAISNTWQLIEAVNIDTDAGNLGSFYVNGLRKFTQTAVTGTSLTQTLYINGRGNTNAYSYATYLGEVIIYNIALNAAQRQQVEGYLATKWGLKTDLSGTHPYKTFTPFVQRFQPLDISGCSVWLDAADASKVTLSGNSVTTWTDKSSNALSLTSAAQPTSTVRQNGLPVVSFTTTQKLTSTGSLTMGPSQTWAIVFNSSTGGNYFIIEHSADTNYNQGSFLLGQNYDFYAMNRTGVLTTWKRYQDSSGQGVPPFSTNTWYIAIVSDNNANGGVFFNRNGTARTISNVNSYTALSGNVTSTFSINHRLSADVNIAEVVVYNKALLVSEVQQLEGYLASKWGLQTSLPSTHPYTKITP
jgi:hypothetical protein